MREIDQIRARQYETAIEEYCDGCGREDGLHDPDCAHEPCEYCEQLDRHDTACPEWVCGHGATGCPYCTAHQVADEGPNGE